MRWAIAMAIPRSGRWSPSTSRRILALHGSPGSRIPPHAPGRRQCHIRSGLSCTSSMRVILPRSTWGSHTHRRVLNHGGGAVCHPVLSRKGSVLHYKCTPVKSRTCLLHMCVAQSSACHTLTDGRPQRAGEPGDACRERARQKNAGIVRTVTRRGCRTPLTRRAMPHPAYRSATSLRLASVSPSM
jgi:hypothetical protein